MPESEPPPMPQRTTAKMLPGNRLLIKMKHRRLAKRVHKARQGASGWDYEAPPEEVPEPAPAPRAKATPRTKPRPAQQADPLVDRVDAAAPWPVPPQQRAKPPEPLAPVERVSYEGDEPTLLQSSDEPSEDAAVRFELVRTSAEPRDDDDSVPETVRIDGPGLYTIDVKRLLEEAPIVVQKDGSYLIHLPSLFDGDDARKKNR
jgi:predicted  nucleic acid-binding Zn-ribbon protein